MRDPEDRRSFSAFRVPISALESLFSPRRGFRTPIDLVIMDNKVQLITYVDRFTGGGMADLHRLLTGPLKNVFGGVHMLPFFNPIDGADAGFDPTDHLTVDPRLGDWSDVSRLTRDIPVMADVIVNHVSAQSPAFQDYLENGRDSDYAGLFLGYNDVFPVGATETQLLKIYRPRPGFPFSRYSLQDGTDRLMWTTFTSQQIDINVFHEKGEQYLSDILDTFAEAGITMVRLDAAGYAVKKAGTTCFMIPETFEFIAEFTTKAKKREIEVLVEIHSYYRTQIEIAERVSYVYDFALPPLILHALFEGTGQYLAKWLAISPRNCVTVLDTHDGIGVIDIGPEGDQPGLIPDAEVDKLVENIHERSKGESRQATGAAASNLDLYQVNCTYYDALGQDDELYILARALQFFAPGVPQVYYAGFLAEVNAMELLHETKVGRDINRPYFEEPRVKAALERPVVQRLIRLIRFRNDHFAFQGEFDQRHEGGERYCFSWQNLKALAELIVDFKARSFQIRERGPVSDEVKTWRP